MSLKESEIKEVGDLRFRCTFQNKTGISDDMGGNSYQYVDYKTVWCKVENQSGNFDRNRADHIETQYSKQFTVRYNLNFKNDMFISYGGYRYDIKNIDKLGEIGRYLLIKAESSEDMKI